MKGLSLRNSYCIGEGGGAVSVEALCQSEEEEDDEEEKSKVDEEEQLPTSQQSHGVEGHATSSPELSGFEIETPASKSRCFLHMLTNLCLARLVENKEGPQVKNVPFW